MTSNFECRGKWWLPNTEKQYEGILVFDPEIGLELELFGTFSANFFDTSTQEIILGSTDVGDVTLIKNYYRNTKRSKNNVTIGKYEPIIAIVGQHFQDNVEITFTEVKFRNFNLFQWLDTSGLDIKSVTKDGSYSINYSTLDDIAFKLHDYCQAKISFISPMHSEDLNNRIEIEERCIVTFKYDEETHYEDVLTDVAYFIGFTTLSTFEQSYPLEIVFLDERYIETFFKDTRIKKIKCLFQHVYYSTKHKLRRKHEHLINYKDIQVVFPNIIENWYRLYKELDTVFNHMLYSFREKNKINDEKFIDNVKALEIYHRIVYDTTKFPEEKYKKLTEKVLSIEGLNKEEKELLSIKMKYGNEPSLNKRLKDLLKDHKNKYTDEMIPDKKKFCREIVDSRNYYIHYDKSLKDKALKGLDLFHATQKVMGILYSCILKKIGLEDRHFETGLINRLFE